MSKDNKVLFVRLRPSTLEMLKRAAQDQRRSLASIVDEVLQEHLLAKYSNVNDRLNRLIGQQ